MSELKEVYAYQSDEIESLVGNANGNSYYLKSEADKVIAEKDTEIARLDDLAHAHNIELLRKENLIAELEDKLRHYQLMVALLESDRLKIHNDVLKIRHQKYKRCLAMARWCMARYNEWAAYYPTTTTRIMKFLDKWFKRWRELADKFKPNSTAQ